ncbi:hypothetical protein Tco_0933619 [Tanacetum coccineum]
MGDSMQLFQQQFEAFMKRYNEDQQRIQSQFEEIRRENTQNSATREPRVNRLNEEGLDRGSGGTGNTNRHCKLDFPRYDGSTDPLPWMSHCDYYFRDQRVAEEEKMSMVAPMPMEVELQQPTDLTSAMYFARLYERRKSENQLAQQVQRVDLSQTNTPSSTQRPSQYVKRLSRADIAERRICVLTMMKSTQRVIIAISHFTLAWQNLLMMIKNHIYRILNGVSHLLEISFSLEDKLIVREGSNVISPMASCVNKLS